MASLGPSSDFSPIAHRYDATRPLPPAMLRQAYERFGEHGLLLPHSLICDAGCGTGQTSAPLLEPGYRVVGFDLSFTMLSQAQAKRSPRDQALFVQADVRRLPAADESFDAVVVSKLFQHVGGWQGAAQELLRVLKPGGCLFHVNERGAFGNEVRKYFGQCATARGFTRRMLGRHDRQAMQNHFLSAGCTDVTIDIGDLAWRAEVMFGDVLEQFGERLFAEFWYLPPAFYDEVLAETAAWVEGQPDGRATIQRLTPYLAADIFRKGH